MLIETWIAALIVVLVFIIGVIGLLGWLIADERLAAEKSKSDVLQEENEKLRRDIAQIKSKVSLAKLYLEMERKK